MEFLRWCRVQYDRVAALLLTLAGALFLVLGWFGLSDKVFPAEQIPFVASGGLGGIFCLTAGGILWLSADLHDEWRKLDRIERRLAAWTDADTSCGPTPASIPDVSLPDPSRSGTPVG